MIFKIQEFVTRTVYIDNGFFKDKEVLALSLLQKYDAGWLVDSKVPIKICFEI